MNRKQIFVILCMFMVFASAISVVSATEIVGNASVSATADDSDISQATNVEQDILKDTPRSFDELNVVIQDPTIPAGGTIDLQYNYTYSDGDSVGTGGIVIDRDITVNGQGHTLDGANEASIFKIQGNAHVILTNINFVNAHGTNGGAISLTAAENVEIIQSNFTNNSASGNGGAIYIAGDGSGITMNSNIVNSTFYNNTALNGGAIYASGTLTSIVSSNFTYNNATNDGGSLYMDVGAHIDECRFEHGYATNDGGAIYLNSSIEDESTIDSSIIEKLGVFNSTLIYCSSGRDGGAGYINANRGTVRNTTFMHNVAGRDGGAGYVDGNWGKLENSTFINNTASNDGGAVMWVGMNGTIYDVHVINNTATNNGGGIYLHPQDEVSAFSGISIVNCSSFTNNSAGMYGGALYCGGIFSIIRNSTFSYDSAYDGAGIYLDVGAAIANCSFYKENATHDGGAIYLSASNTDSSQITDEMRALFIQYVGVRHTTIINCTAGHDGGAGYVKGDRGVVLNTTMINNTAGHDGGAGYVDGNLGQLINSTFINNNATNDGGALYWEGDGGSITNITCIVNFAGDSGGSVYLSGSNVNITLSSFTLSNATNYGGAIYVSGNNVNVTNSSFDRCAANVYHGGALYLSGLEASISYSNFTQNKVTGETARGGSIDVQGNGTKLNNCIFERCTAYEGGALYVNGSNVVISDSSSDKTFSTNGSAIYIAGNNVSVIRFNSSLANATQKGGSIYVEGNDTNITQSIFNTTNSLLGAGIFISGDDATVDNSTFCFNNATAPYFGGYGGSGGGVYVEGDSAKILNSHFENEVTYNYGGAISVWGDNVNITKNTFDKCNATQFNGGAIFVSGSNTTISLCNFSNNSVKTSSAHGGSIEVDGNDAKILECNFVRCSAYEGGVIYILGSGVKIDNSTFKYSFALHNGGAIYVSGSNATISNSNISLNNASENGGAIYVAGNYANIVNSTFNNCTSEIYGGAIYVYGLNTTISLSNFSYNKINASKWGHGGSINIDGHNTTIDECNFDHCTAYLGGVICVNGLNAIISHSQLNASTAFNGGAIYVMGDSAAISNSNISCNNATSYGGAIYIAGDYTNITNTNFTMCIAEQWHGGAIYIEGIDTIIDNSNFTMCNASGDLSRGGAIDVHGEGTNITNSLFDMCHANSEGGAIYVFGHYTLIDNSTFNRSSSNDGGAIYVLGWHVTISESNFTCSNATHYGGAIYLYGSYSDIVGSDFKICNAANNISHGGAIYVYGEMNNIVNSTFENCTTYYGGAIYVEGNNLFMTNDSFVHNFAYEDGSALYVIGAECKLYNSTFTNNSNWDDGVIFWQGNDGYIYNITCYNNTGLSMNTSSSRGGSICLTGNNTVVTKSNFTLSSAVYNAGANSSKIDGGAIFITGNHVNITDTVFSQCNSTNYGGALSILGNYTKLINCTVEKSVAVYGAAMYIVGHDVEIINSTFENNTAYEDGASLYVLGASCKLYNSTFTNNSAWDDGVIFWQGNEGYIYNITCFRNIGLSLNTSSSRGGSICLTGNNTVITKSNFTLSSVVFNRYANTSKIDGGALFITGNNGNITDNVFSQCNATNTGGALAVLGNNTLIDNCTFEKCNATNGGVIYISGLNTTVNGSSFENSNASKDGGAIYIAGLNATIEGSNFTNVSVSQGNGGAIYIDGDNATIRNATFNNTLAGRFYDWKFDENGTIISTVSVLKGKGGAIYVKSENANITDSTIVFSRSVDNGGAIYVEGNETFISKVSFVNCSAGSDPVTADLNISRYDNNMKIIVDNTAAMRRFITSLGISANDLATISSYLSDTRNYLNNLFKNSALNLDNWNRASNNLLICKAFLQSLAYQNEMFRIFLDNITNIESDLNTIYTEQNVTEYNNGLKNNMLRNIDYIRTFVNDLIAFNNSLTELEGNTSYIFGSDDYYDIYDNLTKCIYIGNTLNSKLNSLIKYNDTFTDISGNLSAVRNNLNSIRSDQLKYKANPNTASGGAIYIVGSNATIVNSTFDYIHSTSHGGAVYINGAYTKISESSFNHSTVGYRTSTDTISSTGGAIYIMNVGTNVSYSNFTNGYATGNAGSIFIAGENTTVAWCNLHSNVAESSAGAVFISGSNTRLIYDNFTKNKAWADSSENVGGGALYINGRNASVYNSTFDDNFAQSTGGAILWNGGHGDDSIVGCNFTKNYSNSSRTGGGAIYWTAGDQMTPGGLIKDSLFVENYALHHGAGVDWFRSEDGMIDKCTFINNTCGADGGGLYTGDTNGASKNLTISNCKFINNNATKGSGISNQVVAARIVNNTFESNYASDLAAAIMMKDGSAHNSTIDNCTIYNCYSEGITSWNVHHGGAILIGSAENNITISNCVIVNSTMSKSNQNGGSMAILAPNCSIFNITITNTSSEGDGGAIYWTGANGTANNVTITNSKTNESYYKSGGAIHWTGDYGNLSNIKITNSSTNNTGGAIYLTGLNCNLTNIFIVNSTALGGAGGAIYWTNSIQGTKANHGYNITICNSSSNTTGGAIYWSGSNSALDLVNITNSVSYNGTGGAIYHAGSYANLTNVNITNSSSEAQGGAIFIDEYANHINVANITVVNTKSNSSGGAIYAKNQNTYSNISNILIINSSALGNAGAFLWSGDNSNLNNIIVVNSSAGLAGGAIWFNSGRGNLTNVNVTNSSALGGEAGAIRWTGGYGYAANISVVNSSANGTGGAIYHTGSYANLTNVNITNSNANESGGALYFYNVAGNNLKNIRIVNSSSVSLNASGKYANGGAIYLSGNGNPPRNTLDNVTIINSYSLANGNSNSAHGGAIYWSSSTSNITNINITNSFASSDKRESKGGAIYWNSASGKAYNISITNSSANGTGGAIWHTGANAVLDNLTIVNSHANSTAGSIYWESDRGNLTNVNITNSSSDSLNITNNHASGGAIYWNGGYGIIDNITITNSSSNSNYEGSTSQAHGGAIYWASGSGKLLNANISYSTSQAANENASGGAVYWAGTTGNMTNVSFTNNTAFNSSGGAVYWYGQYGKVYNGSFTNNTAVNANGGAIYWQGANGGVNRSSFVNNTALNGGAIYWTGGAASLDSSEFINNSASENGGAVYWQTSSGISNSTFRNNTAKKGGAIYWNSTDSRGTPKLTNSTFLYNIANQGSAIYFLQYNFDVINSTFLDNRADSVELILHVTRSDDNQAIDIVAEYKGNDNIINAIWNNGNTVGFTNVTYLGVNGTVSNTGVSRRTPTKLADGVKPTDNNTLYQTQYEDYQNITYYIYDSDNNLINVNDTLTNISGISTYSYRNTANTNRLTVMAFHPLDNYYTYIEYVDGKKLVNIEIPTYDIYYTENETFIINVTSADPDGGIPSGNVTIWLGDEIIYENISLTDGKTFQINLTGLPVGQYKVNVSYSGDSEFLPRVNASTFNVLPLYKIYPIKEANISNVNIGSEVNFTIIVYNEGSINATGVNVTDYLPEHLIYVSSGSNTTDQGSKTLLDNGTEMVSWTIGNVTAGTKIRLWVVVMVDMNGTFSNVAIVNTTERGENSSNVENVTVNPLIDLNITKSVNATIVNVSDLIEFTINVTNHGPSNATGVVVNETLSKLVEIIDNGIIASEGTTYNPTTGFWTIGNITNGTTVSLKLIVRVIANGTITNTVNITSHNENDTNISNNNASSDNVTALPVVDLRVNKTVNVTVVNVTGYIKYTINVTNFGPSNATKIVINDTLSNLLNVTSFTMDCEYGYSYEGNGVWYIDRLDNHTSAVLTVIAQVLSNGTIPNTVVVTSHENDTNTSNNNASSDNVTALPIVDLVVNKTANTTGPVNVSDYIEFTINVTNRGPSNATGVNVTDRLSGLLEFVSFTPSREGITYDKVTGLIQIGNLNNGSSVILKIVAKVILNGTVSNVANVTGNENDTNKSNDNSSSHNITAYPIVDIDVNKTANTTGPVNVSDYIEFTINITNHGPSNATGVSATDKLSDLVTFISFTPSREGITYNPATGMIQVGNLNVNESVILKIVVRVIANGTIANTVNVTGHENDTNKSNDNSSSQNITAYPVVDLRVNKTVNVTVVNVTGYIKYTINVTNFGPSNATKIVINDTLSNLLNVTSFTMDCEYGYSHDEGTGLWYIDRLDNHTSAVLTVIAQVLSNGTIPNTVVVTSHENDTNTSNNNASSDNVTALPIVDLVVNKTVNTTGPVNVSDYIEFTINVTNRGPSNATGVNVTDRLSGLLEFVSFTPSREGITYDSATGLIKIGNLNNGSSVILKIVAKVISNGTVSNVANVTSNENDTNKSNDNSSSHNITAYPIVDITVNKTVNATWVNVTDYVEFTINVTNRGPSNATDVNVTDRLADSLQFISFAASRDGITYDKETGLIQIGNLANGSSVILKIVAKVLVNGTIPNSAVAESHENDTNTSNNNGSSQNITALPIVDLNVTKKINVTGVVNISDLIEFTITVTNLGPSNATGILINDTLIDSLQIKGMHIISPYGGGYDFETGLWTVPRLDNGTTATLTIVARVVGGGVISNVVSVTSHENDTNLTNNNASSENVTVYSIVDLSINKTANTTGPVNVSDLIEFTITVTNNGPDNATGVKVTEILSPYVELVENHTEFGRYDKESGIWNIGRLENGTTATLTLIVKVISNGTVANSVNVTSNENDTNKSNNNASSENITAYPVVDLSIIKTVNATRVNVYDEVTYTIVVVNNGPSNATGVNVTESLKGNVEITDVVASKGVYDKSTDIWTVGNLDNKETASLNITVRILSADVVENSVTVKSNENDTNMTNNNYTSDNVTAGYLNSSVSAEDVTVNYGDEVIIPVESENATEIIYQVIDKDGNVVANGTIKPGEFITDLSLNSGNYTINLTTVVEKGYMPATNQSRLIVKKLIPVITIEVVDIWVWEYEVLNVTVNAPGTVNVTVNGVTVTLELDGPSKDTLFAAFSNIIKADYLGKATWNLYGLPVGTYPAFAVYNGNENYESVNTSDIFHVRDLPSTVNITSRDIYVGENETITVFVTENATGNVTITVDGKNYTGTIENGKVVYVIPNLKAGTYSVVAYYHGDGKYLPSSNTGEFKVLKLKPDVDVISPDIHVGEDGVITVTVPSDATGYITIEIEGKRYTQPVVNGKAIFIVPGLKVGTHAIKVYYSGDDKYLPANTTGSIKVLPEGDNRNITPIHNVGLSKHATGNPIVVLLIIILSSCLISARRLKK